MQLIPRVSPLMLGRPTVEPRHLAPYVDVLDVMLGQQRELVFAAPPQHGKTEVTKHALLKWMAQAQEGRFYYVTFGQQRSDSVALDFWHLAERAGLRPIGRRNHWTSAETGSRILFTSIGGRFTGEPLPENGVCVIDDPIKDRQDGLSRAKKETAWGWLFGSMLSRRHPGSSVVCMATRWALDDPSGRLVDEWGFEYINLQAICENERGDPLHRKFGEALWPEERPIEFLEQIRERDPWGFSAMYQGRPTPRGHEVFNMQRLSRFRNLPGDGGYFQIAYGADLAYTADTRADRSWVLRGYRFGDDLYVTGGIFAQVEATSFTPAMRSFTSNPKARVGWYIGGGGEKGVASFLQKKIPMLNARPATTDKLVRATPVAERWNLGHVHLPDEKSPFYDDWVDELIGEATVFTGQKDPSDDAIDALASLHDELFDSVSASDVGVHGFGGVVTSRWASGGDDDWEEDDD